MYIYCLEFNNANYLEFLSYICHFRDTFFLFLAKKTSYYVRKSTTYIVHILNLPQFYIIIIPPGGNWENIRPWNAQNDHKLHMVNHFEQTIFPGFLVFSRVVVILSHDLVDFFLGGKKVMFMHFLLRFLVGKIIF